MGNQRWDAWRDDRGIVLQISEETLSGAKPLAWMAFNDARIYDSLVTTLIRLRYAEFGQANPAGLVLPPGFIKR